MIQHTACTHHTECPVTIQREKEIAYERHKASTKSKLEIDTVQRCYPWKSLMVGVPLFNETTEEDIQTMHLQLTAMLPIWCKLRYTLQRHLGNHWKANVRATKGGGAGGASLTIYLRKLSSALVGSLHTTPHSDLIDVGLSGAIQLLPTCYEHQYPFTATSPSFICTQSPAYLGPKPIWCKTTTGALEILLIQPQ